jgi:hypothetical protein
MSAPKGNKNAETWTIEQATELFNKCLETAKDKTLDCNDFIGEVAQENDTTLWQLDYLKGIYPELETIYRQIKSNCESNCFANGKKNKIVPSLAIMNLKSNHGWTDRVESTNTNTNINQDVTPLSFVKTQNDKDK